MSLILSHRVLWYKEIRTVCTLVCLKKEPLWSDIILHDKLNYTTWVKKYWMVLLKHHITLSDKRLVWSLGGEFLVLLLENWDAVIKCIPIFFCKELGCLKLPKVWKIIVQVQIPIPLIKPVWKLLKIWKSMHI